MANHRYSIEYVACVRNPTAREYLSSVGLPAGHVLFSASEAVDGGIERVEGRDLLKLESGGGGDDVCCIDCETGQVFYVGLDDSSTVLLNSSPQKLSECLNVFDLEITRSAGEDDQAALEELADQLGRSLGEIDSAALEDDPGFWRSILFDVAIGDYVNGES
ncbi:SUKH-4 family immunity protein [Nonomuraea sp. CA-143628]|uniref:SUKH-4 family immunity protein n=1 Tax=Nonomuraea sp. CA-143628 TaxID=3239997 RepID=UPI003D9343C8